jgi:2-oxoglutarate ferredoxin oxidoreductase subunit beta
MMEHPNLKYIRGRKLPHMFCQGCGCGQILNALLFAIDELKLDTNKMVAIGGVGCSSRIPAYLDMYAIHGIHGRNLAYATGVKLAKPELKVVVLTGDGDCGAIGGNHLIHAARRNLDVTVIMDNNGVYAMTGGQLGPTTSTGLYTTTSPMGSLERPFDLCKLVETAGGTYVARWTTAHPAALIRAIKQGLTHRGFSFIEVVSQCPTIYGRYSLGLSDPLKNLEFLKDNSVTREQAEKMSPDQLVRKIVIGKFVDKEVPTLEDAYREMEQKVTARVAS